MPRLLCLSMILSCLFTWTGCTYAPDSAEDDPLALENYPQITLTGKALRDHTLLAEPPIVSEGDYRPMSVTVPLRLKHRDPIKVQYRFMFLDERGIPLDLDPGWKYTVLRGREKTYLQGFALEMAAERWQLQVQETR